MADALIDTAIESAPKLAEPADLAPETVRKTAQETSWRGSVGGYLFLAPWLIGFFGLTLGPALVSLYLSFTDFDLLSNPRWVGAANYVRIATSDAKFTAAMHVTFVYVALAVPLKLVFALMVAMVLNKGIRGLSIYRAMFYLPSLLGASVAIAVLWRQLFAGDGLLNQALALFGIHGPS
jgi:multiple sugar transport system permease protein